MAKEVLVIPPETRMSLENELAVPVDSFIRRAELYREWDPNRLPLWEMEELGHLISPRTAVIIEGFGGVEGFIDDFDAEGKEGFDVSPSRARLHTRWVKEERRHPTAIKLVLLHSGKRTQQELDDYEAERALHKWKPENHVGVNDEIGANQYSGLQERKTYHDYKVLRRIIRSDYGLPERPTLDEIDRGFEYGASEAMSRIMKDELPHHVVFVELARIYRKFFPEYFTTKAKEVKDGFEMPALRLLPRGLEFLRAIRGTEIVDKKSYHERVLNPYLIAIGVPDLITS